MGLQEVPVSNLNVAKKKTLPIQKEVNLKALLVIAERLKFQKDVLYPFSF